MLMLVPSLGKTSAACLQAAVQRVTANPGWHRDLGPKLEAFGELVQLLAAGQSAQVDLISSFLLATCDQSLSIADKAVVS